MKAYIAMASVVLAMLAAASDAGAETVKVELGWGNITPCSKVVWRNNGLVGLPSPTTKFAEQRVYAYAVVDVPSVGGIQNDVQQCAVQGAAAAGIAAIISSPAAAMPAFQTRFQSCLSERAKNYFSLRLEVSGGKCMW